MSKIFFVVTTLLSVIGLVILSNSCGTDIEYVTERGFELSSENYRRDIKVGSKTEVKLFISDKADLRDNFYWIKYFIPKGDGTVYEGRELNRLVENERQILHLGYDEVTGDKIVYFNYIPFDSGDHQIIVTIRDDIQGVEKRLTLDFNVHNI